MSDAARADRIDSAEQAIEYAEHQLDRARQAVFDARVATEPAAQKRLYHVALVRYGGVLSALATLRLCGRLSDVAYQGLRAQALALMQPKAAPQTPPRA